MRLIMILFFMLTACSSPYPNRNPIGEDFPSVIGQTLEQDKVNLPEHFDAQETVLLLGFKQQSQFDIDRWLIGLDMREIKTNFFEIPTIKGWIPSVIQSQIDAGMRKGIPKHIWRYVITVYEDAKKLQLFTGNTNPNNARVILLDVTGKVAYFYDGGFSVAALNELIASIKATRKRTKHDHQSAEARLLSRKSLSGA